MRLEVAAFLLAVVSFADAKSFKLDLPSATVKSVSVAGRKLLSKARRLPEEEQQYNNYNDRNNQQWRYSQTASEYAQQYKSNNQQQYQNYQNQNQQQNNQDDDDDGYKYSGYSSNAQSNVGDYMSNVRYYTGTRDQNWHFYSGRQYNYPDAYGNNNYGSYRDGAYDQGAYSAYGAWGGGQGSSDTSWMSDYSIKFNGCVKDSGET